MPTDFDSSLPVRTQQNGDVVVFLADSTTPSQLAKVDSFGSQQNVIKDATGNAIGSQLISASYWFQVVTPDVGSSAPGTASNYASIAAGIYNSSPITLTNGQQAALQLDSSGRLLVDANINFTSDTNYGTVGANTLRTAAQIGNATGAADFNAGATGAQTLRVEANQGAPALIANAWPVKLTDGTNTVSVTATGELKVEISQPLPAGTNNIGSVNQGTSPWVVSGTVAVSNLPSTVDTNYGAVSNSTIRTASQIGNATGQADFNAGATGAQTLRVASNLYDSNGNPFSPLNPLPVTLDTSAGAPVDDFKDAPAIAAGSSDDHDYVVSAGKTFYLNQVICAGSGKSKMVISIETGVATNTFTQKFVQFNSTADTNMDIQLVDSIPVAAGVRVRVTMSNRDLQAQDLYSTICGHEI